MKRLPADLQIRRLTAADAEAFLMLRRKVTQANPVPMGLARRICASTSGVAMPPLRLSCRFIHMFGAAALLAACSSPPALAPAAPDQDPAISESARQQIAAFESGNARGATATIHRTRYQGRLAYLFIAPCCDRFNELYDADGRRLCAPSGGITGQGDGQCTEAPKAENPALRLMGSSTSNVK